MCCCSRCALGATKGSVTTAPLSLPSNVLQSTATYNCWQLCVVEGAFLPCLHHSHPPCHRWDTASRRDRRLGGASGASQRYINERFQNKPANPFFNLLEATPCLLVKSVRKKLEILCPVEKKSIKSIPQIIACTGSSQNPIASQITSSSKQLSLHFCQENTIRGGLRCLPQQWNEWSLL